MEGWAISLKLSRYGFKILPTTDAMATSFATLDTAKAYALKYSKETGPVYLYDLYDAPHRLVGKAEKGIWRHPVAACKTCKGKCWVNGGDPCNACSALGAILESMPWRPN